MALTIQWFHRKRNSNSKWASTSIEYLKKKNKNFFFWIYAIVAKLIMSTWTRSYINSTHIRTRILYKIDFYAFHFWFGWLFWKRDSTTNRFGHKAHWIGRWWMLISMSPICTFEIHLCLRHFLSSKIQKQPIAVGKCETWAGVCVCM